jgi:glycosyltransferase involved in cell wall biosynthesis
VGNLTYRPNAEAARHLVDEVLPRLRSALGGAVTLTLVGDTGPDPEARALGARPGVRVTGFAPDLEAYYAAADVVVAPITTAGGTRIKLLEAFVHGVPVVTTRAGAAGLDVRDGVHLLLARSAAEFADQVARLVDDGELGPALGTAAAHLVRTRYSHDAVVPQVRAFFRAAAG